MTEPKIALWQKVVKHATTQQSALAQTPQAVEKETQLRVLATRSQYVDRASDVLDNYLKSEEGKSALQLLFVTKERIVIARYTEPSTETVFGNTTNLYISGTGFYATNKSFGDDITTLRQHKNYLIRHHNPFKIVSGYDELHKMIEKMRERLNQIATEHDPPSSPKVV